MQLRPLLSCLKCYSAYPFTTRAMSSITRPRSPSPPPSPHSHSHSHSTSLSEQPQSKRQRLNPTTTRKTLPYEKGMHLAPMVRIGTLPTRLLGTLSPSPSHTRLQADSESVALEYGAELVWGPEIVDKAIIGSTRVVDRKILPLPLSPLPPH